MKFTRLSVQNFAVVESAELLPRQGLNAFTGETGAGKSVIIEALGFALGARASAALIRAGAPHMRVRAEFDIEGLSPALRQKYHLDSNILTLERQLDRNGKSRALVNGQPATAAALAEIGRALVDFHGQHEHQSLLRPEVQLHLLDVYAGLEKLTQQAAHAYERYKRARQALEAAQMSEQEKQQRLDLYAYQLKEIEDARPQPDEDARLEQILPKMKHAGKLGELAQNAYVALYGQENAACELLGIAARQSREMAEVDPVAQPIADALESALTQAEDARAELAAYRDGLHADPREIDEALSRHEKLKRLKLKYGPTLSEVLETARRLKEQMDNLQNSALRERDLTQEVQKARAQLLALCEALHDKRCAGAQKLAKRLEEEIRPLGFNDLRFDVSVAMDAENCGPDGADEAEFLFSPNPGLPLQPLRRAASGGELSRVMLGLKTVLAADVPVMVFDEVDSGVGGRTAALVGRKLRQAAQGRQVLCVTHLASVAAQADAHFCVEKHSDGRTTQVTLRALNGAETEAEIARMLGGEAKDGSAALLHARELLQNARKSTAQKR